MHFISDRILLIALASLVVGGFGELIMIHQTESADNISLTCTAEDDRSALVWNDDLQQNSSDKNFFPTWPPHDPKCAIAAPSRCIVRWQKPEGWDLVHSITHPMGPVFDVRWEGFKQYFLTSSSRVYHFLRGYGYLPTYSSAIVFSVRGKGNVNIKLCGESGIQNSCFSITIPNDSLPNSKICIRQTRRRPSRKESSYHEECISNITKHSETLVDESEWRTFSLEWTPNEVKISSNARIVANASLELPIKAEYLFVGSLTPVKIRFHFYDYYLVEKPNSTLSTSEFEHTEEIFCIELLVSLCSTCELNVQLVDSENRTQAIGRITGNQSADSSLPTWKFDKLNVTRLEDYTNPVRLEILSSMTQNSTKPRWAVDSFRECQPPDAVRSVSSRVESVNSNITCQKLSYTGSCVIKYEATATNHTSNVLRGNCQDDIVVPPDTDGDFQIRNLIWLVIPLISAAGLIILICYQKRKNYRGEIEPLPLAEYSTSSAMSIGTPSDWPFDCHPHPIKLKQFERYVKKAVENGEFEIQYTILPKGLMHPCRIGNLPENKSKNRYGNLIAYDHTRVVLRRESHSSASDYINANYIEGYFKEKAYIATQGPKANTVVDFWRMIWHEDVRVIAMLVNVMEGKKKMCEQYWPEVGMKVTHGDITILNVDQRVYADYAYRTLELTAFKELRQVKHLQYTAWPDQGVPMYSHSIVEYLNELRATPPGLGPIVVHCHAGTGRTGTIILCDICLHHVADNGTVDLYAEAKRMYNARANMLDNLQQYILAHLMPTQCLLLLPTKIPCSEINDEQIATLKKDLKVHMRRLVISSWKDRALRPWEPPKLPKASHLTKNRFPKLMPVEHSLVSLKRYPKHDSNSDYISAVSVDGVKSRGQYLASQLPLPSTLSDFWRLVAEKRVELVVMLQRPGPDSFACIDVIPREGNIKPVPFINVENKMCHQFHTYFTTDKLLLTDTSEKQARIQNVTVLTCNDWRPEEDAEVPPPKALVSLWLASERVSRPEVPTLVLCHDGVTGCGLYIALSFLLERMAVEQECDVILAVRTVRQSRSEFVFSRDQFEYLYDAALEFVNNFTTYSNFA